MQSSSPGLQHASPSCSAFVKAQTVLVGTEDKGKTIDNAGSGVKGADEPLETGVTNFNEFEQNRAASSRVCTAQTDVPLPSPSPLAPQP